MSESPNSRQFPEPNQLVFTLPTLAGEIAFQNKATVYAILFRAAAETLTTIAADPRHLGAQIGVTAVLHTSYDERSVNEESSSHFLVLPAVSDIQLSQFTSTGELASPVPPHIRSPLGAAAP